MAENINKEVQFKMEINILDEAHIKQEFQNQEAESPPIGNREPGQEINMIEGKDPLKSPKKEVLDTVTIDEDDYSHDDIRSLNEDIDLGTVMVGNDSNIKMENVVFMPTGTPSSAKKVKLSQESKRNEELMTNYNKAASKLLMLTKKKKKTMSMSKEETLVLIDLISLNPVLTSKQTDSCTNKAKEDTWNAVTAMFNAKFGSFPRTREQLKLKWENLKKAARKRKQVRMNVLKNKWSRQRVDVAGNAPRIVQYISSNGPSNMHEPLSGELPGKRRVRVSQLTTLYGFLRDNRALVTGCSKTTQGREMHRMMWETVAECLNTHYEGCVKDWKAWSKYWNDYKSRLKNKASQPSETDLSDIDMKFIRLLELAPAPELNVERVEMEYTNRTNCECERIHSHEPTIRTNPVAGPSSEIPLSLPPSTAQKNPTAPRKLRHSNTSSHTSTPKRPDTPPRRLETPPQRPDTPPKRSDTPPMRPETPRQTESPESNTQHQSKNPVRRRRFRREAMTVEEARQRLVANSETRLDLERDRNDILRNILREFRTLNRNFETNGNSRQRFYQPTEDEGS